MPRNDNLLFKSCFAKDLFGSFVWQLVICRKMLRHNLNHKSIEFLKINLERKLIHLSFEYTITGQSLHE